MRPYLCYFPPGQSIQVRAACRRFDHRCRRRTFPTACRRDHQVLSRAAASRRVGAASGHCQSGGKPRAPQGAPRPDCGGLLRARPTQRLIPPLPMDRPPAAGWGRPGGLGSRPARCCWSSWWRSAGAGWPRRRRSGRASWCTPGPGWWRRRSRGCCGPGGQRWRWPPGWGCCWQQRGAGGCCAASMRSGGRPKATSTTWRHCWSSSWWGGTRRSSTGFRC